MRSHAMMKTVKEAEQKVSEDCKRLVQLSEFVVSKKGSKDSRSFLLISVNFDSESLDERSDSVIEIEFIRDIPTIDFVFSIKKRGNL